MGETAKNAALSIAVLILCLFVADRALPLFVPVTKATLESDPLLGLKGRPDVSTIWTREVARPLPLRLNHYGFHDFERALPKSPGIFRIISLGDSFVEAYQLPLQDNFSQRLEQRLNRDLTDANRYGSRRIEVDNQGVHGYGLGVYYLYIEHRIDPWSPNLVLLCLFLGNDLVDNYYPFATRIVPRFRLVGGSLKYYAPQQTSTTWVRDHVLAHSNIASVFSLSIRRYPALLSIARNNGLVSFSMGNTLSDQQRSEILAIAHLQLRKMKEHLAGSHSGLFVLVIPDPARVQEVAVSDRNNATAGAKLGDRAFLEQGLLNILETEGISYEYPLNSFVNEVRRGHHMYLENVGHLTPGGHRQIAQILDGRLHSIIESELTETGTTALGSHNQALAGRHFTGNVPLPGH
jgi:hypothetical protein